MPVQRRRTPREDQTSSNFSQLYGIAGWPMAAGYLSAFGDAPLPLAPRCDKCLGRNLESVVQGLTMKDHCVYLRWQHFVKWNQVKRRARSSMSVIRRPKGWRVCRIQGLVAEFLSDARGFSSSSLSCARASCWLLALQHLWWMDSAKANSSKRGGLGQRMWLGNDVICWHLVIFVKGFSESKALWPNQLRHWIIEFGFVHPSRLDAEMLKPKDSLCLFECSERIAF